MDFFNHFTGFEPIEPENPIGDLADLDDFDRLFASLPDTSSSSRTVRQAPAVSPSAASRIADSTLELSASSLRRGRPFLSSASAPAVDSSNDDACLTKILELFPDISHQYVNDLCAFYKTHALSHQQGGDSNFIEPIIEDILTKLPYPKQKDAKRKRAAEDEEDSQDWKETSEQNNDTMYFHVCSRVLYNEFPHVPTFYIRQVLREKRKLYSAYVPLASYENSINTSARPYERLKRARKPLSSDLALQLNGSLARELEAARKKVEKDSAIARREKEREKAERLNEEEYARAGALVECQCCYTDVPSNRAIPCEGTDVHFFCFACIRRSAETQIGLMKYQMLCFDTSGCQAKFSRSQMEQAVGESIMKKLDSLQQQDEIAKAGLDGLEECPFCEFKAICPPIEDDREFRCCNPDCEIISCRLCKTESHIPQTCEEARKEKGISERHLVEEAMSEALIRTCPRCSVKIIKELGCNKMTCSQCKGLMCYVCKKDITRLGYKHFGHGSGACRIDDDPDRHQKEIDQAEKATIEKIRAENPELKQEELLVQRPEDRKRKKQAHPRHHLGLQQPVHPLQPPLNYNAIFGPPPPPLLQTMTPNRGFAGHPPLRGVPNPLWPGQNMPATPQGVPNAGHFLPDNNNNPYAFEALGAPYTGFQGGMPIGPFEWANMPAPPRQDVPTGNVPYNRPTAHQVTAAPQTAHDHMNPPMNRNENVVPTRQHQHPQPYPYTQTRSHTAVNGHPPIRPEVIDLTQTSPDRGYVPRNVRH